MNYLEITTAKLAEICGVSQGTVDRALNNRPDIKEETKERIIRAAKEYGYRENIPVGKKDTLHGQVGIIVFNLNNEYFSKLITETELLLRKLGYGVVVMITHYDKQHEIECIRSMYNMGVKGIILFSINSGPEFSNYLKLFNIPIVAVGNNIGMIPYVGTDDFMAMKDMTEKLIAEGYENFVYFSPALRYENAYAQVARYKGFLSAASDKKYTVVKDIENINKSYDDRTVIICSTDYYALQVYFKTKNVKITGFDNIDLIDKYKFKIDTVDYSVSEIARNAVDIIFGRKRGNNIVRHSIIERK